MSYTNCDAQKKSKFKWMRVSTLEYLVGTLTLRAYEKRMNEWHARPCIWSISFVRCHYILWMRVRRSSCSMDWHGHCRCVAEYSNDVSACVQFVVDVNGTRMSVIQIDSKFIYWNEWMNATHSTIVSVGFVWSKLWHVGWQWKVNLLFVSNSIILIR